MSSTLNGSLEDLIDAYFKFFMMKVKKANKQNVSSMVHPLDAECNFRFPPLRKLGVNCCCYRIFFNTLNQYTC